MNNSSPRCIVCTRISSQDKDETSTSLESQQIACEAKVREIGGVVVGYCIEAGISGALYEDRTELQSALRRLERKEADVLVWWDLTRLSRDIQWLQVIFARIEDAGAKAVFVTAEYSESTDGFVMRNIMGVLSHGERLKIRDRTIGGRRRRAEQGIQPSRSQRPFGYTIATHKIVIADKLPLSDTGKYALRKGETEIVAQMFELIGSGKSLYKLRDWLFEKGIKSPRGRDYWTIPVLSDLIKNEVYRGVAYHGKTTTKRGNFVGEWGQKIRHKTTATPEKAIAFEVPRTVSDELWHRCQEQLQRNKSKLGGNPLRKSMLSGLMRCVTCGSSMVRTSAGGSKGHPRSIYRCTQNARKPKELCCPNRRLEVSATDAALIAVVTEHLTEPARLGAALGAQREAAECASGVASDKDKASKLRGEIANLQKQEETIVEAQMRAIAAGVQSGAYEKKLGEVSRARTAKQSTLAALVEREAGLPQMNAARRTREIRAMAKTIITVLNAPDTEILPSEKHDLLATVIESVVLNEAGEFEIKWKWF